MTKKTLAAIAALLAVLAGGGTLVLTADPGDERVPRATLTVPVDGLDSGKADDRSVTVPQAAVEQVAPRLENDLREEPFDAGAVKAAEDIAATQEPLPTAGATAGFAGCRTSFVNNQSSRRGVRPQLQVLHYTVSPNRAGWSDVDAVTALFNRSSSQASSHFIIDTEGHCAYIVPIEAKAWTQAAGNPFAVSYEIIATGRESRYLEAAGLAKLRSVMAEVSKRTGIPMRQGAVNGCAPSRTGIVQHKDGGTCWGGHVDITPFSIDVIVRSVTTDGCAAKCQRTRSLRARNTITHAELRRRHCAPIDRTRGERCVFLHRRHRAIHAAAKGEGLKL